MRAVKLVFAVFILIGAFGFLYYKFTCADLKIDSNILFIVFFYVLLLRG